ncbi:MAG: efflux RND transporter periplasmic adaptor subunit [Bryobacteraceae bacterium]
MRHGIVVLLLPFVLLTGCSKSGPPAGRARSQAALISAEQATQKTVPVDIRVIGNVEAYATISVKAQVGGQLTKVYFREGDSVKKGDLLFLIDPRPYDEDIRQAKANLAKNTAALRQAEANLKRDVAQEKYAKEQAVRYEKLFREGVMSKEQADQHGTEAEVQSEAVSADRAAVESARAAIAADEAALANARLERNYCSIVSPVNGRTGAISVKQGNIVKANDSELVTINQIQPILVTFSVPEKNLPAIKERVPAGQLAVMATPEGDEEKGAEQGELSFIDNSVDMTTGTIKMKGTFKNAGSRLWPGQFVDVVLRLKTIPNAVVVPLRAIQNSQSGEYVYVVKPDMTAEMRPVTTSVRADQEVVVTDGLRSGETVVTEGHLRLAPGMKVRMRQAKAL